MVHPERAGLRVTKEKTCGAILGLLLAFALLAPMPARADLWWDEAATSAAVAVPAADAVSQEQAVAHVRALAVDVGSRPADSDAYRRAAVYARDHFESLGYRVTVQDFTYPDFKDLGSSLKLDAEGRQVAGLALVGSPNGEAIGQLVDVGLARTGDLNGLSLEGKLAFAKRGEIPFGEKAENVRKAGAVGMVVYNNEARPLNGRLDRPATIPVLGITQAEGEKLLGALRAAPTAARLVVDSRQEERPSANVVAEGGPPGVAGKVVIGAHLDSVPAGPGANDNASGSAAVLELARVFAGRPEADRLTFVLFGAEELGLIGSNRYVASLGDRARSLRAMLNLDMVAVGDRFEIGGTGERSRDLGRRGLEAARELGYRAIPFDPGGGSDHAPFASAGVPSIMFHWQSDPNYHSPNDTADKVDGEKLTTTTRVVARVVESLLTE
jgi:aminopeptidase YwaD